MALINIESSLDRIFKQAKELNISEGLEVLSYKRNRGVGIFKENDRNFTVRQNGYETRVYQVEEKELSKLLKSIFKKEFPRSRKVRVYSLKNPEELDRPKKKL